MRLTLEQLQAMSDEDLFWHWNADKFPFDRAYCNSCLTQHGRDSDVCHPEIKAALLTIDPYRIFGTWAGLKSELRKHLEELYALRLFYDHLYPRVEPAEPQADPGVAPALCCASVIGESL